MTELDKRHRSSVYDSMVKSPNRAMLRATGMTDESFEKPIVGVISTWAENTPCNIHLHDFGKLAKEGVKDAGAWPVQFGTITVADGIAMGTPGMRFSLTSRDIIADSIEAAMGGHNVDAFVAIGGCDKNMPGSMIAIANMDIPAIFAYGGTIAPGNLDGKDIDLVSVFEGIGKWNHGDMTAEEVKQLECNACPEAIRDWCCHPQDTFYIVGSTMGPHPYPDIVAKMQSVISEELKWQLEEKIGRDYPDYLIACVGGGSNAAGTIYHYIDDDRVKIYLAEAAGHGIDTDYTAATMHCGTEGIIHGARTLVMQTEDGQIEEAFTISAGLDYPGIGPMHADLATSGRSHVLAIKDDEAIYAGYELTRMEGIIPAIESAHAVAALKKMKFKKDDVVVLTVSGRGDKDVETYLSHKEMAGEYGNF